MLSKYFKYIKQYVRIVGLTYRMHIHRKNSTAIRQSEESKLPLGGEIDKV